MCLIKSGNDELNDPTRLAAAIVHKHKKHLLPKRKMINDLERLNALTTRTLDLSRSKQSSEDASESFDTSWLVFIFGL